MSLKFKNNNLSLSYEILSQKQRNYRNKLLSGFTIVELLVVIVVIGILAAITIVSYSGITSKANESSIKTELANASKKLSMYYAEYESYPTEAGLNDTNYCIKFNSGTEATYNSDNSSSYDLTFTKNNLSFMVSESGTISVAPVSLTNCPTGFILVPGSVTYGTSNFCVMKYEAKADDNGDGVGDTNQTTGYNTWPADTYPISAKS